MMTFAQLIRQFFAMFRWWVIIMPWEQAVRVRFGKHVRVLHAGPHVRIPYVDSVFVQSVRKRMLHLPTQTVATKDGKTVTLGGAVAYSITDVNKLYSTLHDAAATVENLCQCAIAEVVLSHIATECTPARIGEQATRLVRFEEYGLGDASICVTDFAFVRTFRIISDQRYGSSYGRLDTCNQTAPPGATPS